MQTGNGTKTREKKIVIIIIIIMGEFRVRAEPNGREVGCAQIYRVTYFVAHCNSTVIQMVPCGNKQ